MQYAVNINYTAYFAVCSFQDFGILYDTITSESPTEEMKNSYFGQVHTSSCDISIVIMM